MSDATCKTCPWWRQVNQWMRDNGRGQCHRYAPRPVENVTDDWPGTAADDWCGEHPDRQPHLECATTTLVTHDDDGPSAADMRRIVDALEKMASRAARGAS